VSAPEVDPAPRGRIGRLLDALDDRTGYRGLVRKVADHPVRDGARFAYAFGGLLLFVFVLQAVTGVALATVYAPTTTDAWGSVYYIEHHMVMGSLVRGVHHFGSSAMIVLVVLHMTQVLLFGAHRKPRELNWIVGVLMLLVILAFGLTGYLLPWDQKGYWATQVATGIMGGAPGGEPLQTLLQGGADYGNQTLTRFYALHVLILPGALITLLVVHLALFYRHGVKASPRREPPRPSVSFWPYQVLREIVLAALVLACLIALALLVGVGLDAPADPASGYEARPDWYFLFLFQLLKYFEGPLAIIGTVIIPGLAVGFLIAVPFIDRRARGTGPSRRVVIPYVAMLLGAATLTVLAVTDDAGDEAFQRARAEARVEAEGAIALAHLGGIDAAGRVTLLEGRRLYVERGCASCHDDAEVPSPGLAGWGSRERLVSFLKDPDAERFFGGTPLEGQMMAVDSEGEDLDGLTDYLRALGGQQEGSAASRARGRAIFAEECTICHNDPAHDARHPDYMLGHAGPDLAGLYGYEWTRALIRDASHPTFYGSVLTDADLERAMPAYPDMPDDELDLLVRWLLAGAPGAGR